MPNNKGKAVEEREQEIYQDILESIFTRVLLIDLVSACEVSKSWNQAVSTSLYRFNKIKPWLILHTQKSRPPYSTAAHAYDPRSRTWVKIHHPSIKYTSVLRSSHSTLLYMLSPSKFSFSFDSLNLTWHHVEPPLIWRTDPVVAMVGHRIVVAGGACDFEDDALAVEMYDLETRMWDTCQSMPETIKDSAASSWLSVAVKDNKMYVTEKLTGDTYVFDTNAKVWDGPYNVMHSCARVCCYSFVGFSNDRFILTGLIRENEEKEADSLRLWELNPESLEVSKEIGEMPRQLLEKLKGDENCFASCTLSISVSMMTNFVYISNASSSKEVFLCELGEDGCCSWSTVGNVVMNDETMMMDRFAFTCSEVGLGDLKRAMVCCRRKFDVKEGGKMHTV